jgi:uncharacterized protein YcbX
MVGSAHPTVRVNGMGVVESLVVYPIKSLDGVGVDVVRLLPSGAIAGDRRFALVDAEGRFVNGKRMAVLQRVRAEFHGWSAEGSFAAVTVSGPDLETRRFEGIAWGEELAEHLAGLVGMPVRVIENCETGFPDDLESPGPTLISKATLATVGEWFGLSVEETARRFRTNVVVTALEAFAEDRWFGPAGSARVVTIGEVPLVVVNPCQRCVVPSRDSRTGEVLSGFQKEFARRREASLPEDVVRERFNHFYRLAINTRPLPGYTGGSIRVGDAVCRLPGREGEIAGGEPAGAQGMR